ncbi:MAG: hypothetical protein GWM98_15415 [Nitrospinaceae bacterium]|nr:discoidin domain-containing protein [Nitrospinaceae bacterium]NIR55613.1 discoidin domain-containing protein [Nitrospinaceae bacterium]NIS86047.1 discoidin domain-containing protein [Nitrospinaceae bacterium]NIT82890.1 discoidin domain-containing protein [Nitrospinaceae bacterium]NIU45095.1 discoidin domain-containing protein [Nitrospinaceae bacterium]
MIIISPGYVLSQGDNASHPHIAYQTWVRDRVADDITVSSETADGPKDAILRPETAEYWQASALPATWTIDLGQARAVDYVGLAGHTIGTELAAVKIEHSPDNSAWTQFAGELAPVTDAPILFLDASISRRYWRITLTGSGAVPKLAVAYMGEVLIAQRGIYGGHSPAPLSRDTELFQNMSDGGQFLGQFIRRRGVNGSASFRNLEPDWYRTNFDPFVKAARQFPFFFAWRPVDYPTEVAYAWTDKNIRPSNMGVRGLMEVSFNFKGIGFNE